MCVCLYGEYVVNFPPLDGVFLPCDHELFFFTSAHLCDNSIINQVTDAGGSVGNLETWDVGT